MKKNFRHWEPDPEDRFIGDPTDNLSYSHSKKQIGFDYNSSWGDGMERVYYFAVLRWVALRVGSRSRKIKREDSDILTFKKPVPFIIYDGYERWPVLEEKPSNKKLIQYWTDEFGLKQDLESLLGLYVSNLYHEKILIGSAEHKALPPEALKILGRKVKSKNVMGICDMPDITNQETFLLVKTLCKEEIDEEIKKISNELRRLNDKWNNFK